MNNNLPGWQILANWENIVESNSFISSISTFYVKSDFSVTDKRFVGHFPNIVLWMIPLWYNNITFNLKQISGVSIDVAYNFKKIVFWVISLLVWLSLWSVVLFVLAILLALGFFSNWIQIYMTVTTSWWITKCPIVFWEKSKAQELVNKLNSAIAENS